MWFAADLLFRGERQPPGPPPLWEERIVLVEASTETDAASAATAIGKEEEHAYETSKNGRRVTWRFMTLLRLYEIEGFQPRSGVELFSRFLRDEEATSLMKPFDDGAST